MNIPPQADRILKSALYQFILKRKTLSKMYHFVNIKLYCLKKPSGENSLEFTLTSPWCAGPMAVLTHVSES